MQILQAYISTSVNELFSHNKHDDNTAALLSLSGEWRASGLQRLLHFTPRRVLSHLSISLSLRLRVLTFRP